MVEIFFGIIAASLVFCYMLGTIIGDMTKSDENLLDELREPQ